MREYEYAYKRLTKKTCIFQGVRIFDRPLIKRQKVGEYTPKTAAVKNLTPAVIHGLEVVAWGWRTE